jgi:uncharacterized membrane protein
MYFLTLCVSHLQAGSVFMIPLCLPASQMLMQTTFNFQWSIRSLTGRILPRSVVRAITAQHPGLVDVILCNAVLQYCNVL